MTIIIDYGCGNPASIRNMLKKAGHRSVITSDPRDIEAAERIIFPGVGSFDYGAARLRELRLEPALRSAVLERAVPILGICVGAQLMCRRSAEGALPGLGWLAADVVRFDTSRLTPSDKIPHMGWSELTSTHGQGLFEGYPETPRFYFAHSYHLQCDSVQEVAANARHGYEFTAAIVRDNIVAVQFHPEKSHVFGMAFLDRFVTEFPAATDIPANS
jgi:glutamine amidotransferase